MIERPTDYVDSNSENDDTINQESNFSTRQTIKFDDKSTKKSLRNGNNEANLLETERDETLFLNSNQHHKSSSDRSKSVKMVDNHQQSRKIPTNIETRRPTPKLPNRSPTRSRSPSQIKNKRQGAFHIFTTNNHQSKVVSSSTSNTPSLNDDRKRLTSSDDDTETNDLKDDDLKEKLKQERRHGKKTGELLNKLHESYEELLEKYAQAENTIDQLRFQPRIFGDNTPTSNSTEHAIHIIQHPKMNINTLRSSGAYHSTTGSPFSSIRPVNSTTTTTTTPVRKSVSPTNSGTIESVFFDEVVPQKVIVEEVTTTPELDLTIQTKSLGNKMKSFLTLMDENQLSLSEQKQVYENIKQDYENLMKKIDNNLNLEPDLNKELETMKQLLKQIVTRITDNLVGKSANNSPIDRHIHDETHSSRLSVRSSLCNHNDLMDQYKKLLNAVNTGSTGQNSRQSSLPKRQTAKPYVYVSGNSDDDDHQLSTDITPIPLSKSVESTSFQLDYIPSTSVKQHSVTPIIKKTNRRSNNEEKFSQNRINQRHIQSFDDEQESISSSSRSSGSGSESPGRSYRLDNSYRRKPNGQSDSYSSIAETYITGSFDPLTKSSFYYNKKMPRSYHTWKQEKPSVSSYRSTSIDRNDSDYYRRKSYVSPQITRPLYRSSIYINPTHTHKQSTQSSNLYLDPQTGVIYGYKTQNPSRISYQEKLYRCNECGSVTSYHHRRHMHSTLTRGTSHLDDLGYESGYKKRYPSSRYSDYSSSSDSDSDTSSYLETIELNEAYDRAEKVQHHSRCLSRNILRQCKLALSTI